MADINQVITLGIGTPAGIREFLTFGLQMAAPPTVAPPTVDLTLRIRSAALALRARSAALTLRER